MRPNRLRPLILDPIALARTKVRRLLLAWVVSCAPAGAASAPAVTQRSFATISVPEDFASLVETARKETWRLRAINGISVPDLGEVGTAAQLDSALNALVAAVEDEIARCERERADYVRQGATADAESRSDGLEWAEFSQSRCLGGDFARRNDRVVGVGVEHAW